MVVSQSLLSSALSLNGEASFKLERCEIGTLARSNLKTAYVERSRAFFKESQREISENEGETVRSKMGIRKGKKMQFSIGLSLETVEKVEAFMVEKCIEVQNMAFEKIISSYFNIREAIDNRFDFFRAGYMFGQACTEASKEMIDDAYFEFHKLERLSEWTMFLNEKFSEKTLGETLKCEKQKKGEAPSKPQNRQ